MGLFDSLKSMVKASAKKEIAKVVNDTVSSVGKGKNRSEGFTFHALPENVADISCKIGVQSHSQLHTPTIFYHLLNPNTTSLPPESYYLPSKDLISPDLLRNVPQTVTYRKTQYPSLHVVEDL